MSFFLADRRFAPLFWTQFFGALNDNFFKNALVVMITYQGVQLFGMDTRSLVAIAGATLMLPFLLFSPWAGQLSDKLEKSRLVRWTKWWELGIMLIAVVGFMLEWYPLLLVVLFLVGTQATFFTPAKYSSIPDLVSHDDLTKGNAFIELGTFLAILLGTILGGLVVGSPEAKWMLYTGMLAFALFGLIASYYFPRLPVANPELWINPNPLPIVAEQWVLLREKQAVFNSVLGVGWFWFYGAVILAVLPVYCKEYLQVGESVVTAFLAMFTLGVGIGSLLCERLSFKRVEIGLVPIGSFGMTLFLLNIVFVEPAWPVAPGDYLGLDGLLASPVGGALLLNFFGLAVSAGLFIVPLYTLIQERSHPETRSQVIAGNNLFSSLTVVLSSVFIMLLFALGSSVTHIFLMLAVINLAVAVYIYSLVPEFVLRFLSWVLIHLLYRVRVRGHEHLPLEGPAILACNHVSYVDWLMVSGAVKRPLRYIMYYKFFEMPIARQLMKQARVIPIAGQKENPAILKAAFAQIAAELRAGELICIFPEGKLTRTGQLEPFQRGILKALADYPVPVIPLALKGLWGSIFSLSPHRRWLRAPWRFRRRVELEIGSAIPAADFSMAKLEGAIRGMTGEVTEPGNML